MWYDIIQPVRITLVLSSRLEFLRGDRILSVNSGYRVAYAKIGVVEGQIRGGTIVRVRFGNSDVARINKCDIRLLERPQV